MPRLLAVQSELCAPLAAGRFDPASAPTVATGIAIADPPRLGQVRAAVLATGGAVLTVSDGEIAAALADLGAMGIRWSPPAPSGGLPSTRVDAAGPVAVVLTGG